MRVWLLAATLLLATLVVAPTASAGPEPPECYDRGPVVDGVVVQVWLTRSCQPKLVVHEPSCWVGDLNICP